MLPVIVIWPSAAIKITSAWRFSFGNLCLKWRVDEWWAFFFSGQLLFLMHQYFFSFISPRILLPADACSKYTCTHSAPHLPTHTHTSPSPPTHIHTHTHRMRELLNITFHSVPPVGCLVRRSPSLRRHQPNSPAEKGFCYDTCTKPDIRQITNDWHSSISNIPPLCNEDYVVLLNTFWRNTKKKKKEWFVDIQKGLGKKWAQREENWEVKSVQYQMSRTSELMVRKDLALQRGEATKNMDVSCVPSSASFVNHVFLECVAPPCPSQNYLPSPFSPSPCGREWVAAPSPLVSPEPAGLSNKSFDSTHRCQ